MFARRTLGRCLAGLAVLFVVGCDAGEGELPAAELMDAFEAGTPREQVVAALPNGGVVPGERVGEAQLLNGYVLERYLIDAGRIEVLWVHDPGAGLPESDGALRTSLNPVVFQDGALDGSGWRHYEERIEAWGLPEQWSVPPVQAPASEEPGAPSGPESGGSEAREEGSQEPAPRERPVSVPNNTSDRV